MKLTMKVAAWALILVGGPARAEWSHYESGISLPDHIGDMKKGEIRDLSGGQQKDVMVQYGAGPLAVTVYVYQASYPNPALWYSRTVATMTENVGGFDTTLQPTPITLAGAPHPNGLRETVEITKPGGRAGTFKSTSFALVQVNDWLLKLRISSQNLGKDDVDKKMDALIGAIKFNRPVIESAPLSVPSPCDGPAPDYPGEPIDPKKMETAVGEGSAQGLIAYAEARGYGGLVKEPDKWCSFDLIGVNASVAKGYREKLSSNFVILVTDSGRSLTVQKLLTAKGKPKAALFVDVQGATRLVWMFDEMPKPESSFSGGMRTVMGQSLGLVTIGYDSGTRNRGDSGAVQDGNK